DDVRISPEIPLPEPSAYHNDAIAARLVLPFTKNASNLRRDSDHFEKVDGCSYAEYTLGILTPRQAETAELIRGDTGEDIILLAPILEIWDRSRALNHVRFVLPDFDESLRLPERQRAQQHRIYDAEDRAVGADAERQRNYRNQSEARIFRQHPRSVPQVL